jgi:acyl-CoA thioesterase FadM
MLDELLIVDAFFGKIGASSIHLNFAVRRSEAPDVFVATGKYVLVAVKRGEFKPTPVPDVVRQKLGPYLEPSA